MVNVSGDKYYGPSAHNPDMENDIDGDSLPQREGLSEKLCTCWQVNIQLSRVGVLNARLEGLTGAAAHSAIIISREARPF